MCKGRGTGGTSALSLERQGCGEKQRPDCQLPPDCTTKISELRVRTGEGGGQKGRGLREEGDGAGSQGERLQQPPVPVQTHAGSTRTQTPSELGSHEDSCAWPEGLRDPCKHACTHTRPCTGTLRHTTAGPLGIRRPTCGPTPPASCQNTASGWVRDAGNESPAPKQA